MECCCEKPIKFEKTELQTWVVFYWNQPYLVGLVGWVFCVPSGKPFLVGLVEMVGKAFA